MGIRSSAIGGVLVLGMIQLPILIAEAIPFLAAPPLQTLNVGGGILTPIVSRPIRWICTGAYFIGFLCDICCSHRLQKARDPEEKASFSLLIRIACACCLIQPNDCQSIRVT